MVCRIQKTHSISKGQKIQFNYINSHLKNNILGKPDLTCIMHLKVNTMKKKKKNTNICIVYQKTDECLATFFSYFKAPPSWLLKRGKVKMNQITNATFGFGFGVCICVCVFLFFFFFFFLHAFWDKFTVKNTVHILCINSSSKI